MDFELEDKSFHPKQKKGNYAFSLNFIMRCIFPVHSRMASLVDASIAMIPSAVPVVLRSIANGSAFPAIVGISYSRTSTVTLIFLG